MDILRFKYSSLIIGRFGNLNYRNFSSRNTKIGILGSGNFGSAIAKLVAQNLRRSESSSEIVKMWVYDELINGRFLTDIINRDHINVKYLPNVKIPENVVAVRSIEEVCNDCDILFFIISQKFLPEILNLIKPHINSSTIGVSLIKGLEFSNEGPVLISNIIKEKLGLQSMAVVMGANLASDIALGKFAETTISSREHNVAKKVSMLLNYENLKVQISDDYGTVEMCGALKNIVAIGAGFCDGLGMSTSSKAALIRQGIQEMALFCQLYDPDNTFKWQTLFESCGVADLFATCSGGRNRLCGEEFIRRRGFYLKSFYEDIDRTGNKLESPEKTMEDMHIIWKLIEKDILHGQTLQGVHTCKEVIRCLDNIPHRKKNFPLFYRIHEISCEGRKPSQLFHWS